MKKEKITKQAGGITDKKDINAGSGAFNQGAEQDPNYNDGVADDPKNLKQSRKRKVKSIDDHGK